MARVLAVDPGTRRCGVAISDSARAMAFPRGTLAADGSLEGELRRLVEGEGVDLVVVGRPVALSGAPTASTEAADRLAERVTAAVAPVAVVRCDERLTTADAQRSLARAGVSTRRQRARIDSAAAVVLLQHYLDGRRDP